MVFLNQLHSNWDNITDLTVSGCGDPGPVANATRMQVTSSVPGGQATYMCYPGFHTVNQGIVGSTASKTCQANGKWSPTSVCQPIKLEK